MKSGEANFCIELLYINCSFSSSLQPLVMVERLTDEFIESYIRKHRVHTEHPYCIKTFVCVHCQKVFASQVHLNCHLRAAHLFHKSTPAFRRDESSSLPKTFPCPFCDFVGQNYVVLQSHQLKHIYHKTELFTRQFLQTDFEYEIDHNTKQPEIIPTRQDLRSLESKQEPKEKTKNCLACNEKFVTSSERSQ